MDSQRQQHDHVMPTTKFPKQDRPTLLTLSGEIRNCIVQYVLTSSKGGKLLRPRPIVYEQLEHESTANRANDRS